jgi:hypothetical protein
LPRAALARAAIAAWAARAAPPRAIALLLAAAARPALAAALLRRRGVLKNFRAAPGRARPPNRLTCRRLGRPRHLPLRSIAGSGRAPVPRLLLPATGGLLRTATSGLLRTSTRSLLSSGARGLLSSGARRLRPGLRAATLAGGGGSGRLAA